MLSMVYSLQNNKKCRKYHCKVVLSKAAAKSVILGRKNQKKVLRNPVGTD